MNQNQQSETEGRFHNLHRVAHSIQNEMYVTERALSERPYASNLMNRMSELQINLNHINNEIGVATNNMNRMANGLSLPQTNQPNRIDRGMMRAQNIMNQGGGINPPQQATPIPRGLFGHSRM